MRYKSVAEYSAVKLNSLVIKVNAIKSTFRSRRNTIIHILTKFGFQFGSFNLVLMIVHLNWIIEST